MINIPVFNIKNFQDYNNCMSFDSNFYIRPFNDHINVNLFIEKPHGHDFYLILLITKGTGTHSIDYEAYDVEPGSLFIVSPGQVHCWNLSDDADGYVLFFKKEYFLIDFGRDKLMKLPFFKSSYSVPYLKLNPKEVNVLNTMFENIDKEYRKHLFSYHEMIRLHLNILFLELSRVYGKQNDDAITYSHELIQLNRFEKLIDTYFVEHKALIFYADKMNISLKQLSYLCKKVINKTPSEVLWDRIILEAKRYVIHTDMPISAIAEALNYSDNSYFTRFFKKLCHLTPEQYRSSFKWHS